MEDANNFVAAYAKESALDAVWNSPDVADRDAHQESVQAWFGHLREFGQQFGYAVNNKQFKE
jgi:hypothetical protein